MSSPDANPWDQHLRAAAASHEDGDTFLGAYRNALSAGYHPSAISSKIKSKLIGLGMTEDEFEGYSRSNPLPQPPSFPGFFPERSTSSPLEGRVEGDLFSNRPLEQGERHVQSNSYPAQTHTTLNYDLAAEAILSDWDGHRISNREVQKRLTKLRRAGYDTPEYRTESPGRSYHDYMRARANLTGEVKSNASAEKKAEIDLANRRLKDPWAK